MRAIVLGILLLLACASGAQAAKRQAAKAPREVAKAEELKPVTPEGWDLFEDPERRFSILLPTHRRTAEAEDDGIPVHIVQARSDDDCEYAVLWSDGATPQIAESLQALLASVAEGRGVSGDHGSVEAGEDRRAGLHGRRLRGTSERSEMDLRAYTDGVRLYKLYAVCPKVDAGDVNGKRYTAFQFAEPQRRAFFGSFTVPREEVGQR